VEIGVARKKRFSETELSDETGKTPHINGGRVAPFKDDFRGSVVS
jgi:hypothetical protein